MNGRRVFVAPCSFKGSLSPVEAARMLEAGLAQAGLEAFSSPLADGGEGTLEVLKPHWGGEVRESCVRGPLGESLQARWLLQGDRAFLESAQACGLTRASALDPLRASSFGVGQMLLAALDAGARRLWIGLGGSATVDGGCGMLQALGARLLDERGAELPAARPPLEALDSIDWSGLDPRLARCSLTALCDVLSPLPGARMFMPQKGATPADCERLAQGLEKLAQVLESEASPSNPGVQGPAAPGGVQGRSPCPSETDPSAKGGLRPHPPGGRALLDHPVTEVLGGGAAGGLGLGLWALGARLESGSAFVFERLGVRQRIAECDLVVTGEGRLDEQTLEGKPILELARLSRGLGRPCVVLCGSRAEDLGRLHEAGVTAVFPIVPGPMPVELAMSRGAEHLREAACQLGRLLAALSR